MASLAREIAGFFRSRPGKIIPYVVLYETIWGVPATVGFENTLRASVCHARRHLSGTLSSVRKFGYIYEEKKDDESYPTYPDNHS